MLPGPVLGPIGAVLMLSPLVAAPLSLAMELLNGAGMINYV